MRSFAWAVTAALLLSAGGGTARADALRCSNEASAQAIAEEATSVFVLNAQAVNHDTEHPIDPSKVSVKLSDTYQTAQTEFTRDCQGHLAISYEGTTPVAEIGYQVIQTDDGRIITKWPRDPSFGQALVMQLILQKTLAEQAAKDPNATPEELARELLTPQGPGSVAAEIRNYAAQHPDMNSGGGRSPPLSGGMRPVQRPTR